MKYQISHKIRSFYNRKIKILFLILSIGLSVIEVKASIIGGSDAICSAGKVICADNFAPACLDPLYIPNCDNGVPACCTEIFSIKVCDNTQLSCKFFPDIPPNTTLEVQILSGPLIPQIVKVPNVDSQFVNAVGFAYPGSRPSFELGIKRTKKNLKINSIDIEDNAGMTFMSVPFKVIDIPRDKNRKIITLTIPSDISTGLGSYTLNLKNHSALSGFIDIVGFLNFKNQNDEENVSEPKIDTVSVKIQSNIISLTILGKNFAQEDALIQVDGGAFEQNPDSSLNTTISIIPASVGASLQSLDVSNKGTKINAKFITSRVIKKDTRAVLVISTPRGSTSFSLILRKT